MVSSDASVPLIQATDGVFWASREAVVRPCASISKRCDRGRPRVAATPKQEITQLLNQIGAGHERAHDRLIAHIYRELKKIAGAQMAKERRAGHSLHTTALVNEAFVRLLPAPANWQNRRHFFAAAAQAMRRILIDRARHARRVKHGGGLQRVEFSEALPGGHLSIEQLALWDQLLEQLEQHDARMAEVIKLRYFVGLSSAEIAPLMALSKRTVERDFLAGKAWLGLHLQRQGS